MGHTGRKKYFDVNAGHAVSSHRLTDVGICLTIACMMRRHDDAVSSCHPVVVPFELHHA